MKAALLNGIEDLKIVEMPVPNCSKREVLIEVQACGICRTDMKAFYLGQRDLHLPRILGHEIAGVVVQIGDEVKGIHAGERVQVAPGLPCGSCSFCLQGLDHLCASVQIMGFHYDGGFAQYVLIPENGVKNRVINKVPDHLSFNETVFTEPLACSINLNERLGTCEGDTVVIYGAGPLGILNARLCRAMGAAIIILMEINNERLLTTSPSDFDYCINPLTTNAETAVMEITRGKGADIVIPCCPGQEAMSSGLKMLSRRGRFGFFSGLIQDSQAGEVDINLIHYKELSVYGAYGCSAEHNRTALNLLSSGKIEVKDLITRIISLDEVLSGIKMVAEMEGIKTVINY